MDKVGFGRLTWRGNSRRVALLSPWWTTSSGDAKHLVGGGVDSEVAALEALGIDEVMRRVGAKDPIPFACGAGGRVFRSSRCNRLIGGGRG